MVSFALPEFAGPFAFSTVGVFKHIVSVAYFVRGCGFPQISSSTASRSLVFPG